MQLFKRDPDPLFDAFPGLETDRLALRRLKVADAPALFELLAHHLAPESSRSDLARARKSDRWAANSVAATSLHLAPALGWSVLATDCR